MGHNKSYTKVVLTTDKETLGTDQPPQALIGKCVKIKVTDTHKWHISGHVIDLAPEPVKVDTDYFTKLDEARKEALLKELAPPVKVTKDHMTHLTGMALVSLATYLLLEVLFI